MTFLAFIFLPISLAGTIFGMNVQQINESGPSISMLLATSIVLMISTLVLWGISYLLVKFRRRVIGRHVMEQHRVRPWKWKLILLGIAVAPQLRDIRYRLWKQFHKIEPFVIFLRKKEHGRFKYLVRPVLWLSRAPLYYIERIFKPLPSWVLEAFEKDLSAC